MCTQKVTSFGGSEFMSIYIYSFTAVEVEVNEGGKRDEKMVKWSRIVAILSQTK